MEQRHKEYVDYYKARYKKFENNEFSQNRFIAEKAMYDAIANANSLEDFQEILKTEKLNIKCAIAKVKDHEIANAKFYQEINSPVRAGSSLEILHNIETNQYENVQDLITMVSDVDTKWQIKIAMDEYLISDFENDWKILEDIEEYEYSQVPESWEAERKQRVADEIASGTKLWIEHTLPGARNFDPNYTPDYDALREERHRRTIPFNDGLFERRLLGHKRYVGEK